MCVVYLVCAWCALTVLTVISVLIVLSVLTVLGMLSVCELSALVYVCVCVCVRTCVYYLSAQCSEITEGALRVRLAGANIGRCSRPASHTYVCIFAEINNRSMQNAN